MSKLNSSKPKATRSSPATPRKSANEADESTPQASLVHLAKVINRPPTTPQNPRPTTPSLSTRRTPVRRTPGAGRLNPLSSRRPPRSPHVIKAFEQRRAATPGRERRKSGRYATARETPRDLLRALSRQLTTTQPYQPTPKTPLPLTPRRPGSNRRASDIVFYSDPSHAAAAAADDDDDDGEEIPPPRLSINLNDFADDDDDERIPPPRMSLPLEDFDTTSHSIEFARRAVSEQPASRTSFGIRLSDRFADFNEMGLREYERPEDDMGDVSFGSLGRRDSSFLDVRNASFAIEEPTVEADEEMVSAGPYGEEESYFLPLPGNEGADENETAATERRTRELSGILHQESSEPELPPPAMESRLYSSDPPIPLPAPETDLEEPTVADLEPELYRVVEREASSLRRGEKEKAAVTEKKAAKTKRVKKTLPISRHGIEYPLFPRKVTKRLATTMVGKSISNEVLNAIAAASDDFFEQVGQDLEAYARHAGRRLVEDGDVVMLMRRQRQLNASTTPFSLAQRYLPTELLQEIRMPLQPTKPFKHPSGAESKIQSKTQSKKRKFLTIAVPEEEEEEEEEEKE